METLTIYWCAKDGIARTAKDGPVACEECGQNMADIGWFEREEQT